MADYRKILRLLAVAGVAAFAIGGLWFEFGRPTNHTAVVRFGVDHSPPFYLIQPDGSVRGLAVDVLNQASRRSGVAVRWIPLHDIPLEDALKRRVVDAWPLVGVTPERRRILHLTKPWIEAEYVLLSLSSQPVLNPDGAAGKTVAHARLKLTGLIANQFLARSILTVRRLRSDAVQALCAGEASAALIESNMLDAIMLSRPEGCEAAEFRIANLTGATTALAIASVPEVASETEKLRAAIADMGKDGFLSAQMDRWSPFSAQGTRSILAQEAADERSRIYSYFLVAFLALSAMLAWLVYRAFQLRSRAALAEAGRREIQRRFTAFMDHSPALAFMKDAGGRMLYVNRAWTRVFGLSADQVYGKHENEIWPPATARQLRATDEALLEENQPRQLVEQVPAAQLGNRDLLVVKFPFANEQGERFIGGTAIDITEREAAIRELEISENRYRELFENNPLPAWVYDCRTLEFLTVNHAAVERYGWTKNDFLSGMTVGDVMCPEDLSPECESDVGARRSLRHQTKDGLRLSVEVTGYDLDYNRRKARLAIIRDVTEQERMIEQLRLGEERWQLALRGAGDALWDWDLITNRVYRSARWCAMLGYKEGEIGDEFEDFVRLLHPDDAEATLEAVNRHLSRVSPEPFIAEYRLRHRDGEWRWIMDRGQAVWDERGTAVRMAGSHTDITGRKATESLLTLQARTDALTGLANRREFERVFDEHFTSARSMGNDLTVCICDLDHFKDVNDFYGHAAGDRVLIAFAGILRENLRTSDVPARIGGDEFVVSLPGTSAEDALAIVERMRAQLRDRAFEAVVGEFRVTSSFGIVGLSGGHRDSDELLAEADRLLYDAKGSGRDRALAVQ